MSPSTSSAPELVHYTYFRSSAAFRTRIALNLKGLKPKDIYIHLRKGQQSAPDYLDVNRQGLVPTLVHDGRAITQSLAIIEYLDEVWPDPPLLPRDALGRAHVRELALVVACDIHPINNLRIRHYLAQLGHNDDAVLAWQIHWMQTGFAALETMLAGSRGTGTFCWGDTPTLADICLIPQMANARGASMDLDPYPTLKRIEKAAYALAAFSDALPKNQPDAE
jgi:maleylacetoacetate isomerase